MDKQTFCDTIGQLVRLQTYQCYKGKALKGDLRAQYKLIKLLHRELCLTPLADSEVHELFQTMNAWDINPEFVCETLKLKVS